MSPKKEKASSLVRQKYTGELADPIYEPYSKLGLLAEISKTAAQDRGFDRQIEKFPLLFEWFNIDTESEHRFVLLALALATAHVPGMQIIHDQKPQRGRRKSWGAGLATELLRDVEALHQRSHVAAIRALRADKSKNWKSFTLQNLITRHREARRAEVKRHKLAKILMSDYGASPVMGGLFGLGSALRTDGKE